MLTKGRLREETGDRYTKDMHHGIDVLKRTVGWLLWNRVHQSVASRMDNGVWRRVMPLKARKTKVCFIFLSNKPDQGINAFLAQADTAKDNDFSYMRNYVWGTRTRFI
jgi:hypothetical protein